MLRFQIKTNLIWVIFFKTFLASNQDISNISPNDFIELNKAVMNLGVNDSVECMSFCFASIFQTTSCVTGFFDSNKCTKCVVYQIQERPFLHKYKWIAEIACDSADYSQVDAFTHCNFGTKQFGGLGDNLEGNYPYLTCYELPRVSPEQLTSSIVEVLPSVVQTSLLLESVTSYSSYSQDTPRPVPCYEINQITQVVNVTMTRTWLQTVNATITVQKTVDVLSMDSRTPGKKVDAAKTEAFINSIVERMTINKNETISYKQKYTSAQDGRTSAKNVGVIAVVLMAGLFVLIVLLDMKHIFSDICVMRENVSGFCNAKEKNNSRFD